MKSIYLGEPHEAVRRVHKMEAVGGEKAAVKRPRNTVDETRCQIRSHLFVELRSELRQKGVEDWVEIVSREIIQEYLKFRQLKAVAPAQLVNSADELRRHHQSVRPGRTAQLCYAEAVRDRVDAAVNLRYCFLCYRLGHRNHFSLSQKWKTKIGGPSIFNICMGPVVLLLHCMLQPQIHTSTKNNHVFSYRPPKLYVLISNSLLLCIKTRVYYYKTIR